MNTEAQIAMDSDAVDYDTLPPTHNSIPLVAALVPLCAAQVLGTRHMRSQVMKLLRDPHVWLPWRNRQPWKNPVNTWWHNSNPWVNYQPWKNTNPCDLLARNGIPFRASRSSSPTLPARLGRTRARGRTPAHTRRRPPSRAV